MSFSVPSNVSPTTGSDQAAVPGGFPATSIAIRVSWTMPTLWVFVRPIGPPRSPASRIHSSPVSSPLPLRVWQPAKTGSRQGSPSCGTIIVTPVRTGPGPADERPVARDERPVADPDAGHVRDRVVGPRSARPDDDPEVACSHPCRVAARRGIRRAVPIIGAVSASPRIDRPSPCRPAGRNDPGRHGRPCASAACRCSTGSPRWMPPRPCATSPASPSSRAPVPAGRRAGRS